MFFSRYKKETRDDSRAHTRHTQHTNTNKQTNKDANFRENLDWENDHLRGGVFGHHR